VSAATFEKRLSRLNAIPDAAIRASARAVIKIAEQEGGSVTLGKKRRRVRLSAVARVKPTGPDSVEVTVWGKPTGVWVWKTTGTKAHDIPKRKPTAKKPRPMHGEGYDHPVQRTQVRHGGTTGHGAWLKVEERAARVIPEIFDEEIKKVMSRG